MTSKSTREQATDTEIQMLIDSHEKGTAMFMRADAYYFMAKELQERRKAERDSEPVAWLAIYHGEVYDEAIGITRSVVEAQADHFGWESALTEIIPLYRHAQPAPASEPIGFRCRRNDGLGDWFHVYHRAPDEFERKHLVIENIYTAPQPAPVVPENCVTAEHRRVIEMLLNVCGSAFELADDSCQQDVDGEECHVVTSDAFQKLSDALDEIENTLPTEDIDRPDVFLAWSAMPRAALKSLLQAGGDEIGSWDNGKYPPSNEPAQPVPDFETVLESLDYDVRCNIRESDHVYQASKSTYDACRAAMLNGGKP